MGKPFSYRPVVMAGEPSASEWEEFTADGFRLHLRVGEDTLLERVARSAARACGEPPVILGPEAVSAGQDLPEGTAFVTGGDGFLERAEHFLQRGFEADFYLALTGDLPFLRSDHLKRMLEFNDGCEGHDAVYPVVRADACLERFPGVDRTTFRVDGQEVTGGNAFLVRASAAERLLPVLEDLLEKRKNPLALALFAGPLLLAKLALGWATMDDLIQAVRDKTGIAGEVFVSPDPELATDVDDPGQWRDLQRFLGE